MYGRWPPGGVTGLNTISQICFSVLSLGYEMLIPVRKRGARWRCSLSQKLCWMKKVQGGRAVGGS